MNSYCHLLHEWFNAQRKFSFPFYSNEIPQNGIYILFEKGEVAHYANRIVRVGSHTGKDQLPKRVNEHFLREHKDRSIFRKNIGRAILNKNHDPFLKDWQIDLTSRSARQQYAELIDRGSTWKLRKKLPAIFRQTFGLWQFQLRINSRGFISNRKSYLLFPHAMNVTSRMAGWVIFHPRKKSGGAVCGRKMNCGRHL
jgi:hypothetical protein